MLWEWPSTAPGTAYCSVTRIQYTLLSGQASNHLSAFGEFIGVTNFVEGAICKNIWFLSLIPNKKKSTFLTSSTLKVAKDNNNIRNMALSDPHAVFGL